MGAPLVAVADSVFPSLDPAKEQLSAVNAEMKMAAEPTPEAILEVARDADGILVTYGQITAEIINELNNCKAIGRFGIGVDNIDIAAATAKGIVVTYCPDYCLDEVSDHAMALLLTLARKTAFSDKLVKSGRWEMPAVVPINRLRGRTLGLFGLGNIPQMVVTKAQAFGINVIAADPYVNPEVPKKLNVEMVDFDALLERSDYISIHAPLTKETENIFSTDSFKKMKSNAFLVNTARGPLVDVMALDVALSDGEIAGAALDVMPTEPPGADHPLLKHDNVILSPHTGFYSIEALDDLQSKVAKDVATVLSGGKPVYPVNPEALES